MRLQLSWPVSCNDLWRAYKGRNILSARARQWATTAGRELLSQKARPILGPVRIDIDLCSPTGRPYDPDNRVKAVLDLLVRNSVIEADNNRIVKRLTITPIEDGFPGATITIRKMPRRLKTASKAS